MKKKITGKAALLPVMAALMTAGGPVAFGQGTGPIAAIVNHYATNNFVTGSLPKADIDRIVMAGVRSPSARNRQPWRFTVVVDPTLARKIIPQHLEGNVIVVISAIGDGKTNGPEILDCALAAQSIYLAAQALGYGSRIYPGPIDGLTRTLKADLGLPAGHSAVALVRLGKAAPPPDGVSAASSRKAAGEVVVYK